MKKWAFVSDFDNTISQKDFYKLVIEKYFPKGQELYEKWQQGDILDIDFITTIFTSINQPEEQIIKDIHSLPIDEYAPKFINRIQQNNGQFYILSAGTDYYIQHILDLYHIRNVPIFSNKGTFTENNIQMNIDKNHWQFSKRYGIDKAKVIQKLKEKYEVIYFAGDSEPDSHPAVYADITFAKDHLAEILEEERISYVPYQSFKDIEEFLLEKGVII